ncbi:MAG: aminotransferase class V-fold PLP-dependent enzyme [Deltaproteobacteria bacterium]|nr:aminotransferase class V-fold PLP-dependent enzyme [Deltaproteobacteria bacterium]
MRTFEQATAFLRMNEVGRRASIETPFGRRLLFYADLTATGRSLHFVEAWMRRVSPFYANTHTAISSTGRIMTELREEARKVVRRAVNAGPEDEVIFVGSGATSAVNKLVGLLGIRICEPLDRQFGFAKQIPPDQRPIVLVGPYEHHSNELPWLESIADVIEVDLDPNGSIDLEDLRRKVAAHKDRPLRIGSFSAGSNVTGLLSDVPAIARILHEHGWWAFFDYAAAGPYVPIDMHPSDPLERIDALFLSMHKFIGGPQASGLLVANRGVFRTATPERPGGGTVDYVSGYDRSSVDYVRRLDEREEGGTPAIMGDIRVGVAFVVKEMMSATELRDHELELSRKSLERLSRHPRIRVLGPIHLPRLAILSLNIDRLHHDIASALLDHLFGIQNRAGCACAGPYGHRLLGIDRTRSEQYRAQIAAGMLGVKPGWVRISLPYYASEADVEFVLRAIEFVADHGRDFVPAYRLGWRDGVWRHIDKPVPDVPPIELTVDALDEAAQSFSAGDFEAPLREAQLACERARYFAEAERMASDLAARWLREEPHWNVPTGRPEIDDLVWFDYVHTDGLD